MDAGLKLELVSSYPESLKVELKRNEKGSTPQRGEWDLKVTIPAGAWTGPMPASAAVVVRVTGDAPRLVRIPVVGIATR